MKPQDPDSRAVVAPSEIRELVARLTEQSIESVPAHEARTLEALAVETGLPLARLRETLAEMRRDGRFKVPLGAWLGFAFLGLFAYWVVGHPPPGAAPATTPTLPPVAEPKAPEPNLTGTVPLTSVTYGPDGGSMQVDPSFAPSKALPEGISLTANVGNLLWGSGDHRSKAVDRPLTSDEEHTVRATAIELLGYVRIDAAKRHLVQSGPEHTFFVVLQSTLYNGSGSATVNLPPPGTGNDPATEGSIRRAADSLVESIQRNLRIQAKWRRDNGP